jgi:hypothetical protein
MTGATAAALLAQCEAESCEQLEPTGTTRIGDLVRPYRQHAGKRGVARYAGFVS